MFPLFPLGTDVAGMCILVEEEEQSACLSYAISVRNRYFIRAVPSIGELKSWVGWIRCERWFRNHRKPNAEIFRTKYSYKLVGETT